MARRIGWFIVVVGYVALVWYGVTGESGPMGWLNALQQRWFDSYSQKASFAVVTVAALLIASPLLFWLMLADAKAKLGPEDAKDLAKIAAAMRDTAPPTASGSRSSNVLVFLVAWLGITAAIWIGCGAYSMWEAHVQSADATARYVPFHLAKGAVAPRGEDHLAVDGKLLWERVVAKRKPSSTKPEEELVPIVGRDWRIGDVVDMVARIEDQRDPVDRNAPGSDSPLLVRVAGAVPTAALTVFDKMQAPISDRAVMVVVVPSPSASAAAATGIDVPNLMLRGIVSTLVWTLSLLAIGLAMLRAGSRSPAA